MEKKGCENIKKKPIDLCRKKCKIIDKMIYTSSKGEKIMNVKKICTSLMITILSIVLMGGVCSNVFAATATTPLTLGIVELRDNATPNMAYSIADPDNNGHIIWNIVKYTTGNNYESQNIYCVNPEIGFGSESNKEKYKDEYNTFYNMKDEKSVVKSLSSIKEHTITVEDNTTISSYDAILALGDLLYLPEKNPSTQKLAEKEEFLKTVINKGKELNPRFLA